MDGLRSGVSAKPAINSINLSGYLKGKELQQHPSLWAHITPKVVTFSTSKEQSAELEAATTTQDVDLADKSDDLQAQLAAAESQLECIEQQIREKQFLMMGIRLFKSYLEHQAKCPDPVIKFLPIVVSSGIPRISFGFSDGKTLHNEQTTYKPVSSVGGKKNLIFDDLLPAFSGLNGDINKPEWKKYDLELCKNKIRKLERQIKEQKQAAPQNVADEALGAVGGMTVSVSGSGGYVVAASGAVGDVEASASGSGKRRQRRQRLLSRESTIDTAEALKKKEEELKQQQAKLKILEEKRAKRAEEYRQQQEKKMQKKMHKQNRGAGRDSGLPNYFSVTQAPNARYEPIRSTDDVPRAGYLPPAHRVRVLGADGVPLTDSEIAVIKNEIVALEKFYNGRSIPDLNYGFLLQEKDCKACLLDCVEVLRRISTARARLDWSAVALSDGLTDGHKQFLQSIVELAPSDVEKLIKSIHPYIIAILIERLNDLFRDKNAIDSANYSHVSLWGIIEKLKVMHNCFSVVLLNKTDTDSTKYNEALTQSRRYMGEVFLRCLELDGLDLNPDAATVLRASMDQILQEMQSTIKTIKTNFSYKHDLAVSVHNEMNAVIFGITRACRLLDALEYRLLVDDSMQTGLSNAELLFGMFCHGFDIDIFCEIALFCPPEFSENLTGVIDECHRPVLINIPSKPKVNDFSLYHVEQIMKYGKSLMKFASRFALLDSCYSGTETRMLLILPPNYVDHVEASIASEESLGIRTDDQLLPFKAASSDSLTQKKVVKSSQALLPVSVDVTTSAVLFHEADKTSASAAADVGDSGVSSMASGGLSAVVVPSCDDNYVTKMQNIEHNMKEIAINKQKIQEQLDAVNAKLKKIAILQNIAIKMAKDPDKDMGDSGVSSMASGGLSAVVVPEVTDVSLEQKSLLVNVPVNVSKIKFDAGAQTYYSLPYPEESCTTQIKHGISESWTQMSTLDYETNATTNKESRGAGADTKKLLSAVDAENQSAFYVAASKTRQDLSIKPTSHARSKSL